MAIAALVSLLSPLPFLILPLTLDTNSLLLPAVTAALLLLTGTLLPSPTHFVFTPLTGDSHHLTYQLPQY